MFQWLRNTWRRYRRRVFLAGLFTGGGYLAWRLVSWRLETVREREDRRFRTQLKRQLQLEYLIRHCRDSVASYQGRLLAVVQDQFDPEAQLQLLRDTTNERRHDQAEWKELRELIFCRMFGEIYGNVLLSLLLWSVLILEGSQMVEPPPFSAESSATASQSSPLKELLEQFFQYGLPSFLREVQGFVRDDLGTVPLAKPLSYQSLRSQIFAIKNPLDELLQHGALKKYLFPPPLPLCEREFILEGALDICEHPDATTVVTSGAQDVVSDFLDRIGQAPEWVRPEDDGLEDFEGPWVPFVKLLPSLLAGIDSQACLRALQLTDTFQTFAANIFESFSQTNSTTTV